ncbi:hypothetical protein [Agromyces sp. Soil535]|uniref:hypothetical protein n=1 Tax=Agromyces sp. Soil535 TaxID=1736390 RepID=UPI0006F7E0A4|nr:hypothetical protein [Agromyces sp. Soil535]KRE24910.1 hypothetical protein ASG80_22590 [Agromyces sp. Soil535]
MDTIARSRELFDLGRHRAAFDLLKPVAQTESAPFVHRRALAQLYRELGCPDQAGRWGIVLDGWTTDLEQDRLARLLAANGVPKRSVRGFLDVPSDGGSLPALNALVEDRVPAYRARFRTAAVGPPMTGGERAGSVGFGFGVAAGLGAVSGLIIVFLVALFGGDAQPASGGAALLVDLLTAMALIAFGFEGVLKGRVGAGTIRIGAGVVLLAVLAGAFVIISAP